MAFVFNKGMIIRRESRYKKNRHLLMLPSNISLTLHSLCNCNRPSMIFPKLIHDTLSTKFSFYDKKSFPEKNVILEVETVSASHTGKELLLSSVPEMDPDWLDNLLKERERSFQEI